MTNSYLRLRMMAQAYLRPNTGLSGATVNAKREARPGAWSDITSNSDTTPITRGYVTIWFDHGTNPSRATYCYQLMPGATATTAAVRAANPNVTVLANTATAQAINCPSLGLTMANFHAAGSAGPITVDGRCSVLISGLTGEVARAVLWVYGNVQDTGGILTSLQAFATASDTWTESSVTWNSAPGPTTALGTGAISPGYDWIAPDVTSAVAAAQASAGGDGTASLAVFEPLGSAGLTTVLNTRMNTTNPPKLEVITS